LYLSVRDLAHAAVFRSDFALKQREEGFDLRAPSASALLSHKRFMYQKFRDPNCPTTLTKPAPRLPALRPLHRKQPPTEANNLHQWYYTDCGGRPDPGDARERAASQGAPRGVSRTATARLSGRASTAGGPQRPFLRTMERCGPSPLLLRHKGLPAPDSRSGAGASPRAAHESSDEEDNDRDPCEGPAGSAADGVVWAGPGADCVDCEAPQREDLMGLLGVAGGVPVAGMGDGWDEELFVVADDHEDDFSDDDADDYPAEDTVSELPVESPRVPLEEVSPLGIPSKQWIAEQLSAVRREKEKVHDRMREFGMER
jgi:hypothetical protein